MGLPLYLAMTGGEISGAREVPHPAWMACHFSPYGQALTNIPRELPEGAMLILNDRVPCQGHSPALAAQQLAEAVIRLGCGSVLLDFQRPVTPETLAMAEAVLKAAPCPVALSDLYAKAFDCIVFLSPCPLHRTLSDYLRPWVGRELWMEAALCQERIAVSSDGTRYIPQFPPDGLQGGFEENRLFCHYKTEIGRDEVSFTLFDTPGSLCKKLESARALGVTKAVGLHQQLWPHRDILLKESK